MNFKDKINYAMDAMEQFITVLNDETDFLRAGFRENNKELRALVERKKQACQFYEQALQSLISPPGELNSLPKDIKQALLDMQGLVNSATRDNALRVKASLTVAEQITAICKKCIIEESENQKPYAPSFSKNKGGSVKQAAMTYSATH